MLFQGWIALSTGWEVPTETCVEGLGKGAPDPPLPFPCLAALCWPGSASRDFRQ